MTRFWFGCATAACLVGAPALARAQPAPMPMAAPAARAPDESVSKVLGVGYKVGNKLGFVGGDLVVTPIDHLTLDLQVSWYSASSPTGASATGFGLVPALQYHFKSGWGSSAYIGVGYLYTRISLGDMTKSGRGGALNAGYEWRWPNGLGVLVGGGLAYIGAFELTDGLNTIKSNEGVQPNLEAAVRYMFF
jgi:hypothetical protein